MADSTFPFREVLPLPEADTIRDRPSRSTAHGAGVDLMGASAPSVLSSDTLRDTHAQRVAPSAEPRRVGDLELLGELARGGMGAVYRALDRRLGREVAVKVMLGGGTDPEERERFEVEARASARLKHPNIVGIHRVGEERGVPYLVMDLVPGESLQKRLGRDGPLRPREAARIAARLARALAFAHARGVLHRDLKPHNVLLTPDGEPILTDFGLAKEAERSRELTVTGQVLGTPAYMAPEQARGDNERVDRRADVYGLGATLYAALTGRPPFHAGSAIALLAKVVEDPVEPPRRARPEVDRDLETIVLKCLEKEPGARYDTAQDLADDLERLLAGEPIQARRQGALERAGRWVRRHRLVSALGVGAVLLAVVVAVAARSAAERRFVEAARLESQRARESALATPEGSDERLGGAMRWLRRAQRWHEVDPTSTALAERVAAAFELATVARRRQLWEVARDAYLESGLDERDPSRARALAELEAESKREAEQRLLAVGGILDDLAAREDVAVADAVKGLLPYRHRDVASELARRLAPITQLLIETRRDLLLRAAVPTELEARGGVAPLDGLAAAAALLEGEVATADEDEARRALGLVAQAAARVAAREGLLNNPASGWAVIRQAQEAALGRGALRVAEACVETLGRFGVEHADVAAPSLTAYLRADVDARRTTLTAEALLRLGVEVGRCDALAATRIGPTRLQLGVEALRLLGDTDEAGSADLLVRRALVAALRGDFAEAERLLHLGERRWSGHPRISYAHACNAVLRAEWGEALEHVERGLAIERLPELLALRGRVLAVRGDVQAARRELAAAQEAAALDPRQGAAEVWRTIAEAYLEVGDADAARAALTTALSVDPDLNDAPLVLARTFLLEARFEDAEAVLERALEEEPTNPWALGLRAELRKRTGDREGALRDVELALTYAPGLVPLVFNRALLLLSLGRPEAAGEVARGALERWPDAASAILARVALDAGRPQEALELCDQGGRAASAVGVQAYLLGVKGEALLFLNRPAEALETAERAVALAPRDANALNLRAAARALQGDRAGAVEDLDRAIGLEPRFRDLLVSRGHLRRQLGDRAGARGDYEQAVAIAPGDAALWLNLVRLAFEDGDRDEVERVLARAIAAVPESAELIVYRADARMAWGDLEGARRDLDEALRASPTLVLAWVRRAVLRSHQGDAQGMAADVRTAVELQPRDVESLLVLVPVLVKLGQVEVARGLVERARPRGPDELARLERLRASLSAPR